MTKLLKSTKLPNPIRKTRVLKPVFITIPCLKFWTLCPTAVEGKGYCVYQGLNARKVNCSYVYSAYILKPVAVL